MAFRGSANEVTPMPKSSHSLLIITSSHAKLQRGKNGERGREGEMDGENAIAVAEKARVKMGACLVNKSCLIKKWLDREKVNSPLASVCVCVCVCMCVCVCVCVGVCVCVCVCVCGCVRA